MAAERDAMVEAAAIAIATHPDGGRITPGSSLLTTLVIEDWKPLARAVIAAVEAAESDLAAGHGDGQ